MIVRNSPRSRRNDKLRSTPKMTGKIDPSGTRMASKTSVLPNIVRVSESRRMNS
jgi:hypothetical protein